MPIIASAKSGGSFEPVSEGVHIANCISIIDLGDQYSEKYDKTQRKVLLTWEVTDETIEIDGEEKPRVISNEYTLSLSEKANLRTHLEAWRGKNFTQEELDGFDLQNVLGKPCQLSIVHNERNGNVYANIKSIMSIPKGMPTPPVVSELTYFQLCGIDLFSLSDGAHNAADMSTARDFIDWMIELCIEYGIPCMDTLLNLCEDTQRYLYACVMHRTCAVCGKHADIHEWDRVGMGRDREDIHHEGQRVQPLCRECHNEVHAMGQEPFDKLHHITWIRLTEEMCRKLGWKA